MSSCSDPCSLDSTNQARSRARQTITSSWPTRLSRILTRGRLVQAHVLLMHRRPRYKVYPLIPHSHSSTLIITILRPSHRLIFHNRNLSPIFLLSNTTKTPI